MRYLLAFVVFIIITVGCTNNPTINNNRILNAPPTPNIGGYTGEELYYQLGCIPVDVNDTWNAAYDYIGGKEYDAIGWGWLDNDGIEDRFEVGDLVVRYGGFGVKYIDNHPYDYQYGITLNFVNDMPRVFVVYVEPLGSMARRLLITDEERHNQIVPCGLTTNATWVGTNDVYTPGFPKPVLYFEDDGTTNTDCMRFIDGFESSDVDVTAADLNQVRFIYGKVWAVRYMAEEDAIHVRALIQLEYNGKPFVQSIEAVLGVE